MANSIFATVVNVNGYANNTAVNDFPTNSIEISALRIAASPTANSRIRFYRNDTQFIDYYVTETTAALWNAANVGRTTMVLITCINFDGYRQVAPFLVAVPASLIQVRPAIANSVGVNSIVLFNNRRYSVSETIYTILGAANV